MYNMNTDLILDKYIFSYDEVNEFFNNLLAHPIYKEYIKLEDPIGITNFGYPINYYTLGSGPKDVLIICATHGCELITVTYIINLVNQLLTKFSIYLNEYTFHIIPILNPEGYIISSSNVCFNIHLKNNYQIEEIAKKYLKLYNLDDYLALNLKNKTKKFYKSVLTTSTKLICYKDLRESVENILNSTNLDSKVLPIWSSNGVGIDPNANSIHKFKEMKKLRDDLKYWFLRYNDIRVDIPSPHSFPGYEALDKLCPENISLYKLVNKLYKNNSNETNNKRLVAFFSYHSTGGEIYGFPDKELVDSKQYEFNLSGMNNYSMYTNYKTIDEKNKFGVMDYYRVFLKDVVTLTVELSFFNGNPIGPYSNLNDVNLDISNNIYAMLQTLDMLI